MLHTTTVGMALARRCRWLLCAGLNELDVGRCPQERCGPSNRTASNPRQFTCGGDIVLNRRPSVARRVPSYGEQRADRSHCITVDLTFAEMLPHE